MDFMKVVTQARELAVSAENSAIKVLEEFNRALPTMKALGFSLHDLQMGMGLLPEVSAKLVASADNIDVKAIDGMIQKESEHKTLVAVLKGIQTAYSVREQLGDLGLEGVEINLKLGIPPNIGIGFVKSAGIASPAFAKAAA